MSKRTTDPALAAVPPPAPPPTDDQDFDALHQALLRPVYPSVTTSEPAETGSPDGAPIKGQLGGKSSLRVTSPAMAVAGPDGKMTALPRTGQLEAPAHVRLPPDEPDPESPPALPLERVVREFAEVVSWPTGGHDPKDK